MSASHVIQQAYSYFYNLAEESNNCILFPLRGVKVHRSGSRRPSKQRRVEPCSSSRQISENQGKRLKPSVLRLLARDQLNLDGSKVKNSVTRMRSETQTSAANEKSVYSQLGKGREGREVSTSGTGKGLWLREAQHVTKEGWGRPVWPTMK